MDKRMITLKVVNVATNLGLQLAMNREVSKRLKMDRLTMELDELDQMEFAKHMAKAIALGVATALIATLAAAAVTNVVDSIVFPNQGGTD